MGTSLGGKHHDTRCDPLFLLREADFGRDNLNGFADLQGANLTSCLIDGANFVGAIYSKETIFPVGFDPTCNEMVLHE